MSQGIFDSINPNTTSGTQLATILDDFKDAVVSGFSGTSRPANLNQYGYWIDDTDAGTGILVYRFYDGTNDIEIFTINTNTQSIIFPGVADEFKVTKVSDDSTGSKLVLEKRRQTGGGQTLENDIIGDIDFEGNDSSSISYVQARIRVVSTDDVSVSEQGCYMALSVTPTDGNALLEILRLTGDKRVGIGGVDTPEKTLDLLGNDSSAGIQSTIVEDSTNAPEIILQKKRSTGNGQVLVGDNVGSHVFKSVDQNGAEIEVARIDVAALENHTDVAQGVNFKLTIKDPTTAAFVEAIKVEDGEVFLYGNKIEGSAPSEDLLAGTNNLISVDGDDFGAFEATIFIHGANASITRQQKIKINGVYDFDNTTWKITNDSDSMGGSDKAVTLGTPTGTSVVSIDYTNQIPTFIAGKIYKEIKRFTR